MKRLLILITIFLLILGGCVSTPDIELTPTPTYTPSPTPTPRIGHLISAVYSDTNDTNEVDEGDTITLSFDEPINPISLDILSTEDFYIKSIGVTESAVDWEGFSEFRGDNYKTVVIELVGKIENLIPGKSIINVKIGALETQEGAQVCWKPVRILK